MTELKITDHAIYGHPIATGSLACGIVAAVTPYMLRAVGVKCPSSRLYKLACALLTACAAYQIRQPLAPSLKAKIHFIKILQNNRKAHPECNRFMVGALFEHYELNIFGKTQPTDKPYIPKAVIWDCTCESTSSIIDRLWNDLDHVYTNSTLVHIEGAIVGEPNNPTNNQNQSFPLAINTYKISNLEAAKITHIKLTADGNEYIYDLNSLAKILRNETTNFPLIDNDINKLWEYVFHANFLWREHLKGSGRCEASDVVDSQGKLKSPVFRNRTARPHKDEESIAEMLSSALKTYNGQNTQAPIWG